MTRHVLTAEDRAKALLGAAQWRIDGRGASRLRREAELYLLNRLLAELAMPEWYPER